MTIKEICNAVYESVCDTFEEFQPLLECCYRACKWVLVVGTIPIWIIPYAILKRKDDTE